MHKVANIPIDELNHILVCAICRGYIIDATTIIECLHSFCKSCIVKFLEDSNTCPVCDTLLHKTRPQYAIRADNALQSIIYKLVPSLFEKEMLLRRQFYSSHSIVERRSLSPEKRGDLTLNAYVQKEDDRLSIELEYWPSEKEQSDLNTADARYQSIFLLCPPDLTIGHLEKLIRMKFELKPDLHDVAIFFSADDCFNSDYTLSDLACLYYWRRHQPMKLYFSIIQICSVEKLRGFPNKSENTNIYNTINESFVYSVIPQSYKNSPLVDKLQINPLQLNRRLDGNDLSCVDNDNSISESWTVKPTNSHPNSHQRAPNSVLNNARGHTASETAYQISPSGISASLMRTNSRCALLAQGLA